MAVYLIPIDKSNLRRVIKLQLNAGEEKFVAPNAYSIAEAYTESGTMPRAIYADEEVVGFTLFGQWQEDEIGDLWVARLMVDKDERGKGHGEEGMRLAIKEMLQNPICKNIYTSFVPDNIVAKQLYEKLGFVDTGRKEHGESIYLYKGN